MTLLLQKLIVYSINVLNFKGMSIVNISLSVKYNKTLAIWDPYYLSHIAMLEKIQRQTARWAVSDYNYLSSVSTMLYNLNWPPLAQRRKQHRLNLFYQTIYNLTGLSLPEHYQPTTRHTRHHHPFHLIIPPSNTTAHYYVKFLPKHF